MFREIEIKKWERRARERVKEHEINKKSERDSLTVKYIRPQDDLERKNIKYKKQNVI